MPTITIEITDTTAGAVEAWITDLPDDASNALLAIAARAVSTARASSHLLKSHGPDLCKPKLVCIDGAPVARS